MATSPSQSAINRKLRQLQRENPTETYRVIRASNGEVAILTQRYIDSCYPKRKEN